jgi:hypothetical protein
MAVFTNVKRNFDFGSRKAQVVVRNVRDMRHWHALLRPLHAGLALLQLGARSASVEATPSLTCVSIRTAGPRTTGLERIRSSYCRPQSQPRPIPSR